jgi:hypothetical protein
MADEREKNGFVAYSKIANEGRECERTDLCRRAFVLVIRACG